MERVHSLSAARTSFNILKITFTLVSVLAGLDKFTNILVDWKQYLNPDLAALLPLSPATFMIIVGIIEIVAGLLVFFKPALGGIIVSAWLTLIALTLIAGGNYFDIAVRDLVMAISAFCMARMAAENDVN